MSGWLARPRDPRHVVRAGMRAFSFKAEREQIAVARQRGQVIHPINHEAVARDLMSSNKSARRRGEKTLAKMEKRGLVR